MEELKVLLKKLIYKEELKCNKCPVKKTCEVKQHLRLGTSKTSIRTEFEEGSLMAMLNTDTPEYAPITYCAMHMLSRVAEKCIKKNQEIQID